MKAIFFSAGVAAALGQQAVALPCNPAIAEPVPACMVGVWAGQSNMAEVLNAFFATLPEDVRALAPAPPEGELLFLHIGAAGQYFASPLSQGAEAVFTGDRGGSASMQIDVKTTGSTGQLFTAAGGQLAFCNAVGGGTVSISGGGTTQTAMIPAIGAPGAAPPMRYSCDGDQLKMMVDLPPPMSTVTYDLRRRDESALPEALRGRLTPAP